MEIEEKIKRLEESCQRLLEQDLVELNKKIDWEIERQIKDEIEEYQRKEEFAYQKKLEKLEKEYNKQRYALEMEMKKEILNERKKFQKDLNQEVIQILKEFTKTPEYKPFLMKRIEETIKKLPDTNHSVLHIVNEDAQKYGDEIQKKYQVAIQIIEDDYIGGCILEDNIAGIYIDHTLQNSVNEKLENEMR